MSTSTQNTQVLDLIRFIPPTNTIQTIVGKFISIKTGSGMFLI